MWQKKTKRYRKRGSVSSYISMHATCSPALGSAALLNVMLLLFSVTDSVRDYKFCNYVTVTNPSDAPFLHLVVGVLAVLLGFIFKDLNFVSRE